jgi:NMD protein affecting ribosome stability and mRNA decay
MSTSTTARSETQKSIKCPKCGGDVYAPTFSGICPRCHLLVFPSGETLPAPIAAHHNEHCDMVRGPCCCGAWHSEQEQIAKARGVAPGGEGGGNG